MQESADRSEVRCETVNNPRPYLAPQYNKSSCFRPYSPTPREGKAPYLPPRPLNRFCLSATTARFPQEGDEEALAVKYDCKLVHRLENEFSPYTRCDAQDVMLKLATFVVDPRFQGDSLFLKLYGDALGPVADMVKAAYNYIIKAADIKPKKVFGRRCVMLC